MSRGASSSGSLDGQLTVDARGTIVEINPAAAEILEISRSEAIGESMHRVIPPEHRRASFEGLERVAGGGRPRILDQRRQVEAMLPDGSRVEVEMLLTKTSSDPPRFTAWLGTALVSRSEMLAARAEEATGLGSWELDIQSGELTWSDNLYRLMGLEVGAIEPSLDYVLDQVHADDRSRVEAVFGNLTETGLLEPLDYRIVFGTGEVRDLCTTLSVTDMEDGRPAGAIGSVQDLTDRRRVEREIAARRTATEILRAWTSLAERGPQLIAGMAGSLDALAGAIWVPRGDWLEVECIWASEGLAVHSAYGDRPSARLPRGLGMPGLAWERERAVSLADNDDSARARRIAGLGLRGGVAFPTIGGDVNMVVELLSRERIELTESLAQTLRAIGHEIGEFMARHRGELEPRLLTPREIEILQLAARGLSGPAIAERLFISPATVKTHFEHTYTKLDVPDRSAAVAAGLRLGLID